MSYTEEDLKNKKLPTLIKIAIEVGVENPQELEKHDLKIAILKKNTNIQISGALDIVHNKFGLIRGIDNNFKESEYDAYVSLSFIKQNGLRIGDVVKCIIEPPKKSEDKYYSVKEVLSVNNLSLSESKKRPLFDNLTPIYTNDKFKFEYHPTKLTGRVIDLFSPMGKGQRGLVVAPPKTGKTELLKELAHGISTNHPDVILMVLLVDERPEEVTDMERSVKGEVFSSTFDLPAENHVKVAEMVIERAKRLVENKKDVVILLDSITRLARAYNTVTPSSGKVLSGGVDANALHKPKRFFGAARNIEEGGSLTIISTALIETGSKMDEVIFEEFKGTGNSEVVLNRSSANKRIYPAIDLVKSGTRKEELLLSEQETKASWALRGVLSNQNETEGLKFILDKMNKTKSNKEFLEMLK